MVTIDEALFHTELSKLQARGGIQGTGGEIVPIHSFTDSLWFLFTTVAKLSSCDRDHVAHSLTFLQFGPSPKHFVNFSFSIVTVSDPTIVLNEIRKCC